MAFIHILIPSNEITLSSYTLQEWKLHILTRCARSTATTTFGQVYSL